jgi:hypothetical protein
MITFKKKATRFRMAFKISDRQGEFCFVRYFVTGKANTPLRFTKKAIRSPNSFLIFELRYTFSLERLKQHLCQIRNFGKGFD